MGLPVNTFENKDLTFLPLNLETWNDFTQLFGERGACGGCWCMAWRLKRSVFEKQKGAGNKKAMHTLVKNKEPVGILAYSADAPVGWCAVAPREKHIRLENSRVLKKIDDKPVWSVTCFFIAKPYRGKGLSSKLLQGVIAHCRLQGVKIIEAYPEIPYQQKIPDAFAWKGIPSAFEKVGFQLVEKRSKTKLIMRYYIK